MKGIGDGNMAAWIDLVGAGMEGESNKRSILIEEAISLS